MREFLDLTFYNNTVSRYLVFLGCVLLSIVAVMIIVHFLIKRLKVWADKSKAESGDVLVQSVKKYLVPVLYFTAVFLCTKILTLDQTLVSVINTAAELFAALFGGMLLTRVVIYFINLYWQKKKSGSDNKLAIRWINGLVKFLIWCAVIILFLQNAGIKIDALLAGLGIGGLAIAFAAQVILQDVFCFFTILFDRPFEIGDFIVADEYMGTVEHIGVKTTRLRALSGEQLVMSNADLTGSRIKNYKTMAQRRVLFTLGVAYNTRAETLSAIPGIIKEIIDGIEGASFSRTHFFSYGEASLNFEIAYYVLSSDYDKYMDINQQVNLKIKETFDKRGIEFAFPTQILYVNGFGAPKSPGDLAR